MPTQLSFSLGGSHRQWLTMRGGTNPFSATPGPLPQLVVPLEARLTERDIEVQILSLVFDLKLGNTLIGRGDIGPYLHCEPTTSTSLPPPPAHGRRCPISSVPFRRKVV